MNSTPEPQTAAVDRIPLTHSVRYVARGLPDVPNQYGQGVLRPSEITLTYRAAPDSQLGRVHAYVAGRLWADGREIPLLPSGGLYGQYYDDGLPNWPGWLAEEARLHDPESAAVSVAVPPTMERRQRIIEALYEARRPGLGGMSEAQAVAYMADAVLAVADAEQAALRTRVARLTTALGEAVQHVGGSGGEVSLQTFERWRAVLDAQPDDGQTDTRAAALREAADRYEGILANADTGQDPRYWTAVRDITLGLRAMADEAHPAAVLPQPETQAGHDRPHMMRPTYRTRPGDATVDPATCPQCKGDNSEAFALCDRCAATAPDVVAYQSNGGRLLRCLAHAPEWAAILCGDFHPVTSEDLPDGGLCTFLDCGVDVLIPQEPSS